MISPTEISTVASLVLAQYDVSEAFLFGSFARGEQTPNSDIDLRLVCGNTASLNFVAYFRTRRALEASIELKLGSRHPLAI